VDGGRWLIVAAVQAATVILGGLWGRTMHYPGRPPTVYTALAVVAVLLMASGLLRSLVGLRRQESCIVPAVGGSCLAYCVALVLLEPFLEGRELAAVIQAALMLVLLLLAFSYLARRGVWASAAGVALFVFASAAMLAGNAGVSDAGSGFFTYWVS
jgi:hypothetical protein